MRIKRKHLTDEPDPPPEVKTVVEKVPVVDPALHALLTSIAARLEALEEREFPKPLPPAPTREADIIARLDRLEALANRPPVTYDFPVTRVDGKITKMQAIPVKSKPGIYKGA